MGLTTAQLEAGDTIERARQRFRAFAGADPIASWTPSSLAWAAPLLPDGARTSLLKTSYCNLRNHRAGLLEDALAREGLSTGTVTCHGRAAGRLGCALALAAWLRERDEGARPCS